MLEVPVAVLQHQQFNYCDLVFHYLPVDEAGIISAAEQSSVLTELLNCVAHEKFFTITDIRSGDIVYSNGTMEWLGVAAPVFTTKKFLTAIHPAHAVLQAFYAVSLFEVLNNQTIQKRLSVPLLIQLLSLKNRHGSYCYFKREVYQYQLTVTGRLTEYASVYTLIKEYGGENFHCRFPIGPKAEPALAGMYKSVQKLFKERGGLTTQEYRILLRHAGKDKVTNASIANAFKITKGGVEKCNQRILQKCRNLYQASINSAEEAGKYFKEAGLIVGG